MMNSNDHVQWLRRQGDTYRQAAEAEADSKAKAKLEKIAARMFAAAGALEAALAGGNAEMAAGHGAVAAALKRGASVRVHLVDGKALSGTLGSIGKYDFLFTLESDVQLIIPKHAVLYYELPTEDGYAIGRPYIGMAVVGGR